MNQQFDIGKLPPQAVDLEERVLGGCMLYPACCNIAIPILPQNSMYKEAHNIIWNAIIELHKKNKPVGIDSVYYLLKEKNEQDLVGGLYYISRLTDRHATPYNIEHNSRIISQKFILREIIRLCSQTINTAYAPYNDVFELSNNHFTDLSKIIDSTLSGKKVKTFQELIAEEIKLYESRASSINGKDVSGVPSGFFDLDNLTGGFQDTDLIVVGARPSMGKTALMLCIALNAALRGVAVKINSLETSAIKLLQRFILILSEIDSERYKRGSLDKSQEVQLNEARAILFDLGIEIDDESTITIQEMHSGVRSWNKRMRETRPDLKKRLVMADYLQLFVGDQTKNGNREQEVASVSKGAKKIAKEEKLPFVLFAQLSRKLEERTDKRPMLSDLRESGAIEQDADIVGFLFRPEYYGISEIEGMSTVGYAELDIAKNRDGALDTIKMRWNPSHTRFSDINEQPYIPSAGIKPNTDFTKTKKESDEDPF